ncbi:winged helix-turn-helix transcriptional regulator [Paremcibacter congregatus]|uniref:Transcriptional regulator n=1 Tax=Paremcibacter congregatus TaxID=2043170 RepID=A0A2G4YQ93_9PROT|nr:helix-turn-helix domain-containing protein [Paremcibacter congregatus]PHZ84489.1 transcriptional regulator [Paremcibacter congregatus]QDE28708.1 helix-turn-helix transcriptional regulator [Paremcibacter congregatus]|tara:strand:+ start:9555 stop:9959 length:405 start_codon:yes stop_codon:yes gene_type:complete
MDQKRRSYCPVTFALDVIGDKWSLLILRDILLMEKRFYHEFAQSKEGISTNILANRLSRLEGAGIVTKERDSADKKRFIYRPTEKGLDLLPVVMAMVQWSLKYDPDTKVPQSRMDEMNQDLIGYMAQIRSRFQE